MSYLNSNSKSTTSEINLVEQILDQGQRLRTAMVESILSNDPFYNDYKPRDCFDTNTSDCEKKELSVAEKHRFVAYLKGDNMSQADEKIVLNTFRSMSNADICEVTERSYANVQNNCNCDTCKAYYTHKFNFNQSKPPSLHLINPKFNEFLKSVDTLKIAVHSLKLNYEGNLKVASSFLDKKMPQNAQLNYFIEYEIPPSLIKLNFKKSKVDTGLDTNNNIRLCSKKLYNEVIYFKQISIHDIIINEIDLDSIDIKFQISCRILKQKRPNIIGFAKLNLNALKSSNYLSCNQELVVVLNECKPIVLGTLKVNLQLGCGRIYYGKEFIDAISNNKENFELPETPIINDFDCSNLIDYTIKTNDCVNKPQTNDANKIKPKPKNKICDAKVDLNVNKCITMQQIEVKNILFGFIYISEAEFLGVKKKTYLTCQPFCQDDIVYSCVINGTSNPLFNFHQIIPIIYEDSFITKLRDNFMIFEFWEKNDGAKDELIGISKISLHQYYLAFRNSVICKYLERNKLPVIGTDWHESIQDPITAELTGQVEILVALGSEDQIRNLEKERGFKDNIVIKAKRIIINSKNIKKNLIDDKFDKKTSEIVPKTNKIETDENIKKLVTCDKSTSKIETVEIGTQSDVEIMEPKPMNDALGALLDQLITQRPKIMHEVATNTALVANKTNEIQMNQNQINEHPKNYKQPKKIVDLCEDFGPKHDCFKAKILVDSALHLPSKFVKRKVKGKLEILPNTYVSFITGVENDVRISQVVPKNKGPKWDFLTDVYLPLDLLNNNQKRLIFKVWKIKSPNLIPNIQMDTVIGFAALDLTVLAAGLPTVSGWFNIVDFTGNCKGQIKINITPLENIIKLKPKSTHTNTTQSEVPCETLEAPKVDEEPGEMLSRALKRKFTELDEITQRLRSRLSNVTNFDTTHTNINSNSNDETSDEFENDINTLCVEEDYDTIDFVKEAQNLNLQRVSTSLKQFVDQNDCKNDQTLIMFNEADAQAGSSRDTNMLYIDVCDENQSICDEEQVALRLSSNPIEFEQSISSKTSGDTLNTLDQQLTEGKQRIDTLLQKLTLIGGIEEPFINRYVSGCSINPENSVNCDESQSSQEEILKELDVQDFDGNQFFDARFLNQFKDGRLAPEGEGHTSASSSN